MDGLHDQDLAVWHSGAQFDVVENMRNRRSGQGFRERFVDIATECSSRHLDDRAHRRHLFQPRWQGASFVVSVLFDDFVQSGIGV